MNATLIINWPSGTILTYRAEWCGETVTLEDNILEDIFFSDKFEPEWDNGYPDMDIVLNGNPEIRSRVIFVDNIGDLCSTKDLDRLLKK